MIIGDTVDAQTDGREAGWADPHARHRRSLALSSRRRSYTSPQCHLGDAATRLGYAHYQGEHQSPLWTLPTLNEPSELQVQLTVPNGGSAFHRKEEQRWEVENQVRLMPGSQYLAMLTYGDVPIAGGDGSEGPKWFTLEICRERRPVRTVDPPR